MEKLVIFQDIIHYPLFIIRCNPVTQKHKIQCVIEKAGKKNGEKSIRKIPSH